MRMQLCEQKNARNLRLDADTLKIKTPIKILKSKRPLIYKLVMFQLLSSRFKVLSLYLQSNSKTEYYRVIMNTDMIAGIDTSRNWHY